MGDETTNFLISNGITGLGIFFGIVAGALVQVLVSWTEKRTQKSRAKKVVLGELIHNHGLVERVISSVEKIRNKASVSSLQSYEVQLDMREFDYSSAAVLLSSGWYYILLSESQVRAHAGFRVTFNQDEALRIGGVWGDMAERKLFAELVENCDYFISISKDRRKQIELIYKDLSGSRLYSNA